MGNFFTCHFSSSYKNIIPVLDIKLKFLFLIIDITGLTHFAVTIVRTKRPIRSKVDLPAGRQGTNTF